jgi:hypothetical protein
MEMVIRLPPTLEERVTRAAKEKGMEPGQLVEAAVNEYLSAEAETSDQVSEERRELRELLRHKKETLDFDAEVDAAKRAAGRMYEDNADWIENTAASETSHGKQ